MPIDRIASGSNIFELIELRLSRRLADGSDKWGHYGVNVAKVREVIRIPHIEPLGAEVAGIAGLIELRGVAIPIVNLCQVLGDDPAPVPENGRIIITEFSNKRAGFVVHEALKIRRVEWESVQPPSSGKTSNITGMVLLPNSEFLFILDLEKIVNGIERLSDGDYEGEVDQSFGSKGAGECILVVEDSSVILNNVKKKLTIQGYKVISAADGKTAWDLLQTSSSDIDAIVSDVEMPQMDGLTLIKKIKESEALQHLPVILHSSLSGDASKSAGREVGAYGYVVKNDFESLFAHLRQALSDKVA